MQAPARSVQLGVEGDDFLHRATWLHVLHGGEAKIWREFRLSLCSHGTSACLGITLNLRLSDRAGPHRQVKSRHDIPERLYQVWRCQRGSLVPGAEEILKPQWLASMRPR